MSRTHSGRRAWLLLMALTTATQGHAQEGARAATAPDSMRLAVAHRVLKATGAADLMISAMKATLPSQKLATPQLPPEFWTRFEARMVQDAPQLVDSLAAVYANTFTLEELQQLAGFYESPIGRRVREAQPALLTQSSAIGRRWGSRIGAEVGASLPQ